MLTKGTKSDIILLSKKKGGFFMAEKKRSNTSRFLITLGNDLIAKLDETSKHIGVTRSALCATLISDGLKSREQAELFMAKMPLAIERAMNNPEVVKELKSGV